MQFIHHSAKMVPGRPLLYLSLPGVAFILGVFWFRRRNKNRKENGDDTDGKKDALQQKNDKEEITKSNIKNVHCTPTAIPSKSMNINGSSVNDDDNSTTILFGKSAPIQIVQNGRTSPIKQSQQQIDSEVLKTKIQDAENKVLRSIDEDFENLSSPVDLPDSVNNRVSFYSRSTHGKKDEPVVIKATRTPKISPENSFLESKYTKESEQNNNSKGCDSNNQKPKEVNEPEIAKDKKTETNINEKRNVDAASPSLSLCSMQSGDSGKGSSLPRSEANRGKTSYEFFFPTSLIGQLYGRKRTFINQIESKTSAKVTVRKNPFSGKLKICVIEGIETEINAALMMIRQRLPVKRYPNFTMQRIHFALPQTVVPLSSENMLNLQVKY